MVRPLSESNNLKSSFNSQNKSGNVCASIAQRLERQPCKVNWLEYKDFLHKKYAHRYAHMQFNNARKYLDCYDNPSKLSVLSVSTRANVMKALVCLSKYLGTYLDFKQRMKQYGIKWTRPDSFQSFLRIMKNNHKDLLVWYRKTSTVLHDNEKLYLKFMLLSGLRKEEGLMSFNLIIELYKKGILAEYYNEDLSMLEHYKFKQFLRNTKNTYITIISRNLVLQIAHSKPVSYHAIHNFLGRKKIRLRMKELRQYYASFMVRHNIISEEVDLLQGRIPKSIFARHYLRESPVELRDRTLEALKQLDEEIS